jgi:hypothetical protein
MRRDAEPSSDVLRAHSPLVGQSRDKLVSIPVFAWCYATFCQGQDWVASLQAWQLMPSFELHCQERFRYISKRKRERELCAPFADGAFQRSADTHFFRVGWRGADGCYRCGTDLVLDRLTCTPPKNCARLHGTMRGNEPYPIQSLEPEKENVDDYSARRSRADHIWRACRPFRDHGRP